MDLPQQDLKTIRRFTAPFRVERGKGFGLADFDPGDTLHLGSEDKPRAQEALRKGVLHLAALQVAAAALNARSGGQPVTRQIARTLGLEAASVGDDRARIEPRHHGGDRSAIDAAGKKEPVGDV